MEAELKLIPLDLVDDHPDNPRIGFREDVIDAIAANIDGAYEPKHAIHVRPLGNRYQILGGHHRKRAAQKAGLAEIWAWVEEVSDEDAFMALVLDNNQGELSPLEIGIHAYHYVPLAEGGRGKKGGLAEYARRVGKDQALMLRYRQAAEVYEHVKPMTQVIGLSDRAQHLAAIHKLPKKCWEGCVERLGKFNVEDAKSGVQRAQKFLDEADAGNWGEYANPFEFAACVFDRSQTLADFNRLVALAQRVYDSLEAHADLQGGWRQWLIDNRADMSWDIEVVQRKRLEFEAALDARNEDQTEELPKVQVLLADPPWKYDFAETDSRQIENHYPSATVDEICAHLYDWGPELDDSAVLYLWATAPKLREALQVMDSWGFKYKTHAVWDKERVGMGYWFRGQHELLLVGTRGSFSPPEASVRVSSVFRERRDNEHSVKPECVYQAIERMFPDAVKYEMYQRSARDGWTGGGNEAE